MIANVEMVARLTVASPLNITNRFESNPSLELDLWTELTSVLVVQSPYWLVDDATPENFQRFYRVTALPPDVATLNNITMVPRLTIESGVGITNQIEFTTNQVQTPWTVLTNIVVAQSPYWFTDVAALAVTPRFYRVSPYPPSNPPPPPNMALIPSGAFSMGDALDGLSNALPAHPVNVTRFYMDKFEVTKALWDEVYQWAVTNGYSFEQGAQGIATNHPVHSLTWYDALKWCNARSEREGRGPAYYTGTAHTTPYRIGQIEPQTSWVQWDTGYRLPTEAEWEKAARGGADGNRFPWSGTNTIAHSLANYFSFWQNGQPFYPYDESSTSGYHPLYSADGLPHTSPAGAFAPNDYGLHDLAGNVWEWCWDWWSDSYYGSSPVNDPRGPAAGSHRVLRGGSWATSANGCRTANRGDGPPDSVLNSVGFRSVLPVSPP